MADMVTVEEVADAMFKMVSDAQGMKKLKPMDLTKTIRRMFEDRVDRSTCKAAIKSLIESGRCAQRRPANADRRDRRHPERWRRHRHR